MQTHPDEELEIYGDTGITSANAPIPRWLLLSYLILPLWGVISFFLFWNGPFGYFDRGYWSQLEEAANTKFIKREMP